MLGSFSKQDGTRPLWWEGGVENSRGLAAGRKDPLNYGATTTGMIDGPLDCPDDFAINLGNRVELSGSSLLPTTPYPMNFIYSRLCILLDSM